MVGCEGWAGSWPHLEARHADDLLLEVFNHLLLVRVNPTGQAKKQKLKLVYDHRMG
jgi:hypothetical protein